MCKKGYEPVV